jgi:hypothetical protein
MKVYIKKLLNEGIKIERLLKESLEDDFKDVTTQCITHETMKEWLQASLDKAAMKPHKRPKSDVNKPILHNKDVPMSGGEIDVEKFIEEITTTPTSLITKGNSKMAKSGDESVYVVSTGIPAFKGIIYNKSTKEFHVVDTCPGAGTCVKACYARFGSYVRLPNVVMAMTRRLNLLINEPSYYEKKIYLEAQMICEQENRKGIKVMLRWNDSGDFFGERYYKIARNVTKKLHDEGYNFLSYAYTKMGEYVSIDDDFITNFSRGANITQTRKVDLNDVKQSIIVPFEMFEDIFKEDENGNYIKTSDGQADFISPAHINKLKATIAKEYDVKKDTLLLYSELPSKEGSANQYNVIVLPTGDGDRAAARRDVMISFLLQH